jgi:hypothetical protein
MLTTCDVDLPFLSYVDELIFFSREQSGERFDFEQAARSAHLPSGVYAVKHESFTTALLNGFEPIDEVVQTVADIRGRDFDALLQSPGDGFGGAFHPMLDAAF